MKSSECPFELGPGLLWKQAFLGGRRLFFLPCTTILPPHILVPHTTTTRGVWEVGSLGGETPLVSPGKGSQKTVFIWKCTGSECSARGRPPPQRMPFREQMFISKAPGLDPEKSPSSSPLENGPGPPPPRIAQLPESSPPMVRPGQFLKPCPPDLAPPPTGRGI